MLTRFLASAALIAMMASTAAAEEIRIQMLNKGEAGAMVYEPNFVQAQPGDTIIFEAATKGHNAETIKGMYPEGFEPFKSKLSQEFSVTLDMEGLYGIKCTPHYGMGMVALIQVGEPVNIDAVLEAPLKGKAKKRFAEIFENL